MSLWTAQHNPKTDCKWFRGHIPCLPHKQHGYVCGSCQVYEPLGARILIIKLGAAGDVIRTTPLLRRLKADHPRAELIWLTCFPELVPVEWVNKVLKFELPQVTWLVEQRVDWLINLDKDDEAIALAERIQAARKSGFGMDAYGKCRPFSSGAETSKWLTGLWDDANKANRTHYMQEIFEICGYVFAGEPYIIEKTAGRSWEGVSRLKPTVGLNTGCGGRWMTRLWENDRWIALARQLIKRSCQVVLLGGPQEDAKNRLIAQETGALYPGHFDLPVFIDLVDQCDVVVTQVTMAMHLAIGLNKRLVLLNNIFNRHEFHLYGRGMIIEPDLSCLGCFKQAFDARCPVSNCMELISADRVLKAVEVMLEGITVTPAEAQRSVLLRKLAGSAAS